MESQSNELFLNFTKMHGLRNDFILINETKNEVVPEKNKSEVTKILCDRHKGIGADGIIFVSMPTKSDYDICFRIFNPGGTEAGMCGNGIRCFTKFVHDNKILGENLIYNVETRAGLRIVEVCSSKPDSSVIKVDMGVAEFSQHKIPFVYKAELVIDCNPQDEIIEKEIIITSNLKVKISAVSVGIPHAVIITDCILDILEIGPHLEIHDCFPERVNVHCMKINTQKNEFFSASWEAYVGHTLACGTGATSCALIGVKLGYLRKNEIIHANLEGGKLQIVVSDSHDGKLRATMKGEAVKVFDGTMKIYL
jgi:diaminopimelate epimerase